ncbi:MAG: prepilin-type N-terminal cleavage/methylation domain-containing protein, partial [Kiritimatiellaeota bacterium]|nr:prepilin-type N-terminal cleavage/methylation domain-containing protein [Kiritimatiellota bacterium]
MRTVRSGGFTLLELLVGIAIILILAGLMIPAFSNIAAKTRRITCMNNIR